jgi:predicted amidophosphoribosyltransferase
MPSDERCRRSRTTTAQFDLDREARAGNVEGVFRLAGPARRVGAADMAGVAGRAGAADVTGPVRLDGAPRAVRPALSLDDAWIVLVDDVLTTGATLAACARVLLACGALAVSAVTVARER